MNASKGSIGGSADDTGTEYKRGVVAYVVAYGLSGARLQLDCLPSDEKRITAVDAETDDPVDDVRVEFSSGRAIYIQAKHTLKKGRPLTEAVQQWREAAQQGLDRERHRIVIACEELNGPMKTLAQLLERRRSGRFAALTDDEKYAKSCLDDLLKGLTKEQKRDVWACGAIWNLHVRELAGTSTQNALGHLRHIVDGEDTDLQARRVWIELMHFAGKISRQRTGVALKAWGEMLEGASLPLTKHGSTPSASILRRRDAVQAYLDEVTYRGTHIDLRALGGDLPDIDLTEADARLDVSTREDYAQATTELRWAFLRRHRMVLTGLPGGGKSTALRQLAAQFAVDSQMPFPVYASLRNFNPDKDAYGLLPHIINEAVSIVDPEIAHEVAEEIRERLTEDHPLALLLDSLDETYDRRHAVVSSLSALTRHVPSGTAMLLATRDVAYAQAKTLGWYDLRLMPPKDVVKPVRAILKMAESTVEPSGVARPGWVETRSEWVLGVLSDDPVLKETPLFASLLALLAARRNSNNLPTSRGAILVEVVADFILNRELNKRADLLDLSADEAQMLGLHAFATEAHVLLNNRNTATETAVVDAIAARVQRDWGFSRARSAVVATRVVRIFDEAGVFVIGSEERTVSPRIALLAEVGDAMMAIEDPDLEAWVRRRIAAEQFEPLILAFTLSADAVKHAIDSLASSPDIELARSIAIAAAHGAALSPHATRSVAAHLMDDLATVTMSGWRSWRALYGLPLVPEDVKGLLARIAVLPVGYQHIIRSDAYERWGIATTPRDALSLARATLAVDTLPVLRIASDEPSASARLTETGIVDAQVRAASRMLQLDPSTAYEIADRLSRDAGYSLHTQLWDLLREHGDEDALSRARKAQETLADVDLPALPFRIDNYVRLLDILSAGESAELTTYQQIATPDVARLFRVVRLYDSRSMHFVNGDPSFLRNVFATAAALYDISVELVSAEATVIRTRVEKWSTTPLFATMDDLEDLGDADWSRIADVEATVDQLIATMHYGEPQARFAANALAAGPPTAVAEKLQSAVTALAHAPRFQRIGALALAQVLPSWEPQQWMHHANPILREVVVLLATGSDPLLRTMVAEDPDQIVRVAALYRLATALTTDADAVQKAAEASDPVGWMCRSCCTSNPPAADVCEGDSCFHAAPKWGEHPHTTRVIFR